MFNRRIRNLKNLILPLIIGKKRYRARTFASIYRNKRWGGKYAKEVDFHSGSGSLSENTVEYEELVAKLIADHQIESIVDIGCGDFQVAKRILERLKKPVNYLGCDLVPELVQHNLDNHASESVNFQVLDAVEDDIPQADLILVREVLQHLSNASVARILEKISVNPQCLITNSIHPNMINANIDIAEGGSTRVARMSGLDVRQPPFNSAAEEVLILPHANKTQAMLLTLLLIKDQPAS